MLLPEDRFPGLFDVNSLARGRRYFAERRVHNLNIQLEGFRTRLIRARVQGSRRQAYEVFIRLDPSLPHSMLAECTCPVGFHCKHAVATLLQANHQAGDPSGQSASHDQRGWMVRQWTHALEQALNKTGASPRERLVYELVPSRDTNRIHVRVSKATPRKAGGFAGMTAVGSLHRVSLGADRPGYLQTEDVPAISCWRALGAGSLDGCEVSGPPGYHFLVAAQATGRLFWGGPKNPPLQWGEPMTAHPGWTGVGEGWIQPVLEGLPDTAVVMLTDPPCYLDKLNHRIGLLELPIEIPVLAALLQAPPLPADTFQAQVDRLQPLLKQCGLALPEGVKAPRLVDGPPIPQLILRELRLEDREAPLPLMEIRFRYEDQVIPWQWQEERISGESPEGHPVQVCRDRDAERDYLISLGDLEPVARLSEVNRVPSEYRPCFTLTDRHAWLDFLTWEVPILRTRGWEVFLDESLDIPQTEAEHWYGETGDSDEAGWFDMELGILQDDQRINLVPLLLRGLHYSSGPLDRTENGRLELPEHLWLHDGHRQIRVPSERVRPLLEVLLDLYREPDPLDGEGRLKLARVDAARVVGSSSIEWQADPRLRQLGERLENFDGLDPAPVPAGFNASLRHYQQQGVDWLQFLRAYGLGGLLADDMGLGKTIQTLAHIWIEKVAGRLTQPALVVCPTSLLPNWRREAEQFAPRLRVLTLHGPGRKALFPQLDEADLVLTSYPLLSRDAVLHQARTWSVLVFDEAQALKNPRAAVSRAAREIRAEQVLALTGTPMENHLGELWSLFDCIQPGYLGSREEFRQNFRHPIEKDGNPERRKALVRRIRPFLLRRTKDQVTPELPEKTEMVRTVELTGAQRDLYETIRASMDEKIRRLVADKGVGRSQIEILEALLKLRQVCCHPALLDKNLAERKERKASLRSAKLEYLLEMIEELLEEGRRILIFSQFTSMLALIEQALADKGWDYTLLTGQTRDRATPVERFQSGQVPLFLISLKAGGVGLNLTAADCVIHYDPWWNPAVESQATDRAWRIGQDKPVFVYRLICEGTVEERMQALQERKAKLADSVYGKGESLSGALTAEDVQALFRPLGH